MVGITENYSCNFKIFRPSVDGKHSIRFRSVNAVSKFLGRGVDEEIIPVMYQSKLILQRDSAEPLISRGLCGKERERFEFQDDLSNSRVSP